VNRAPRAPARRAELARALARLLGEVAPGTAVAAPLMVPHRRDLDAVLLDAAPLPRAMCSPLHLAVEAVAERAGDRPLGAEGPVPVAPGSLGTGGAA
jgi:hypothetical protein